MTINLINIEQHSTLLKIYKNFPILTFQNQGYQYIDETKLSVEEHLAISKIEQILSQSIYGFNCFNNFKINKNNEITVRFQYNYNYESGLPFTGVGYILLDELLFGFKN
ncbi:MAG: hypothetical protein KA278_00280 [Flavobacterium sp.]|nr:hypothetical protein [Flavobacterium sp.]